MAARTSPPTALDIGTVAYDHPAPAGHAPRRRYLLCGTQRTGSTLLCRLLIQAGIGVPHEYLNPRHVQALQPAWGVGLRQGLPWLQALYRHRTTANGVWGLKLQWPQFVQWMQGTQEMQSTPGAPSGPDPADALFAGATLFQITRRDRHAQAVSLHLSLITGLWGVGGVRTTPERHDIALGDPQHLRACARAIAQEDARWQSFHASRRHTTIPLVYEDLVADQAGTVERIAQALGLGRDDWHPVAPEAREPARPEDAARAARVAELLAQPELTAAENPGLPPATP